MKKFLILTLVLASFSAMSQAKDGAIKTNLTRMLPLGIVNLAYEMPMNDKSSLQLGVSIGSDYSIPGFGIAPEYRIYSREALQGFYFGPVARYVSITKESFFISKAIFIGVGGQFGWNWLLGKSDSFVMNLGLGAVYYSKSIKGSSAHYFVAPILSFSIGYAW